MSDVFISHVEEDKDTVPDIVRSLEAAGYTTWSYERDSYPGPDYLDQVERAIDGCRAVVVLISPDSLGSQQVEDEVKWAREQRKYFLPVLKGISWAEFQNRRPRWRMALGIATAVSIPAEGVGVILPRLIRGLDALGVQPSVPPTQQQHKVAEPPKSQKQLSPEEFVEEAKRLQQAGNYAEAFRLFKEAAAARNREAMTCLGHLYANGRGGVQDYAQACEWYQKAAASGSAEAMCNLGALYAIGRGVAQDYARARQWYEKAAATGNANAMYLVGGLYFDGKGVAQDYEQARQWYEKAAAAGSTKAMVSVGRFYANGQGVAQDYEQARQWYEKAAAAGSTWAMHNLGVLWENGWGVPQDSEQAREWYQKSTAKG